MLNFLPSGANLFKETGFKSQKLQHYSDKDSNQKLRHLEVLLKATK